VKAEDFQTYVLEKLDRIADDVAQLKGKSYVWGAVAGTLSGIGVAILAHLFGRKP
jgi:hypothetical protein